MKKLLPFLVSLPLWAASFEWKDLPTVTKTKAGNAGDPVNVAFFAEEASLAGAFHRTGWRPADPRTLEKVIVLLGSLLFHRPDPSAPVSNLYLWNRVQDLAFEKEAGPTLSKRHHVRLWKSEQKNAEGLALWIGGATFDSGIFPRKFSHHIAPKIDAERDFLFQQLGSTHLLYDEMRVSGPNREGKNGEGDPWVTDGFIRVASVKKTKALNGD